MKALAWGLAAVTALTLTAPVDSRNTYRWEYLGGKSVKVSGDRDVISVGSSEGNFRKLQFVVRENGIYFNSMTVEYSNGADDNIPLQVHVPAGGRSRLIDLRGGDRYIRKIRFSYRAVNNGRGRAQIEVFGRR